MTRLSLRRLGGLSAILAGGLSIVLTLPSTGLDDLWIHVLQGVLMLFGIVGVYLYQHETSGIVGFLGFILAFIGAALFLASGGVAESDSFTLGGCGLGLGFILLGIGSWFGGKLPRWIPVMWILGSAIGIPAVRLVSLAGILLLISATFFAAGFIGAGIKLWSDTDE